MRRVYRILDLFSGAGGAGEGYRRAGFIPTGVDINRQPRYPYQFIRGDALEYLERYGHLYDVIHASPPCQRYSKMQRMRKNQDNHPDLIAPVRQLLQQIGRPYIIENVEGAPLIKPIVLCGSQFGLKVYRHRLFESNLDLSEPLHFKHQDSTPPAGQGKSPKGYISLTGGGIRGVDQEYRFAAMGISWMTNAELKESIPPAFTEYLGKQVMRYLTNGE